MLNKLFSIFNRKKKAEVKVVSNIKKSDHKKKQYPEKANPSQTSDTFLLNPLHPLNPSSPIYSLNADYDQKTVRSSNPYSSPASSDDSYGGGKSGGGCSPSSGNDSSGGGGGCGGGGGGGGD